MRKFLTSSLAAVTFAGAVLATATPAAAAHRYYRHHRHHGGGDAAAAAIVAGIAGLAIGSALSNRSDRGGYYYQDRGYYGGSGYAYDPRYDSYYGSGYYAPPRRVYRTCTRTERFWDPYVGGYVRVKRRYAC